MMRKEMRKIVLLPLLVFLSAFTVLPLQAQPSVNVNNFLLWGSTGYSRISNNAPDTKASGRNGMALGGGYEMHFTNFLLQTGLELSYYTSDMSLKDTLVSVPMVDTEGNSYTGQFTFQHTTDRQSIFNVGIPLMFGYESPEGMYFAIGGKAMLNLTGRSKTTTYVTSTAYYDDLIGDNNNGIQSNMPDHGLTSEWRTVKSSFHLQTLFFGSIEAGYTLGKNPEDFSLSNKPKIRLSVFCDYGFAPVATKDKTDNLFVNTSNSGEYLPAIQSYLLHNLQTNRLNVLYAGLKVTVLFGIKKYSCHCTKE